VLCAGQGGPWVDTLTSTILNFSAIQSEAQCSDSQTAVKLVTTTDELLMLLR